MLRLPEKKIRKYLIILYSLTAFLFLIPFQFVLAKTSHFTFEGVYSTEDKSIGLILKRGINSYAGYIVNSKGSLKISAVADAEGILTITSVGDNSSQSIATLDEVGNLFIVEADFSMLYFFRTDGNVEAALKSVSGQATPPANNQGRNAQAGRVERVNPKFGQKTEKTNMWTDKLSDTRVYKIKYDSYSASSVVNGWEFCNNGEYIEFSRVVTTISSTDGYGNAVGGTTKDGSNIISQGTWDIGDDAGKLKIYLHRSDGGEYFLNLSNQLGEGGTFIIQSKEFSWGKGNNPEGPKWCR